MTLSDVTGLTLDELQQLLAAVNNQVAQRQQDAQAQKQTAKAEIAIAKAKLNQLIGPDAPTAPGLNSYTEIKLFTDTQIQSNLVLAVRKLLEGAEAQARIVRDIVVVLSNSNL